MYLCSIVQVVDNYLQWHKNLLWVSIQVRMYFVCTLHQVEKDTWIKMLFFRWTLYPGSTNTGRNNWELSTKKMPVTTIPASYIGEARYSSIYISSREVRKLLFHGTAELRLVFSTFCVKTIDLLVKGNQVVIKCNSLRRRLISGLILSRDLLAGPMWVMQKYLHLSRDKTVKSNDSVKLFITHCRWLPTQFNFFIKSYQILQLCRPLGDDRIWKRREFPFCKYRKMFKHISRFFFIAFFY